MGEDPDRRCPCGSGKPYADCCQGKPGGQPQPPAKRATLRLGPRQPAPAAQEGAENGGAEDARIAESGSKLVRAGRTADAVRVLGEALARDPELVTVRDRLAYAHWTRGEVRQAFAVQLQGLQRVESRRMFGLAALVHWALLVDRLDVAESAARGLERLSPPDEVSALRAVEALALLERDGAVRKGVAEARARGTREWDARLRFCAAVACLNLGDYAAAEPALAKLAQDAEYGACCRRYLDRVRRGLGPGTFCGRWVYFKSQFWVPPDVLERWLRSPDPGEAVRRECAGFPRLAEVIFDDGSNLSEPALEALARLGTPAAVRLLSRLCASVWGPDELRACAQNLLEATDRLPPGTDRRLFWNGRWTVPPSLRLAPNRAARASSAAAKARRRDAFAAVERADWSGAERAWREVIEGDAQDPAAHRQLAVALWRQARAPEAEAALDQALALDTEDPSAVATRALWRVEQGRVREARALLDALGWPEGRDAETLADFHVASARVALAEHDLVAFTDALLLTEAIARGTGLDLPGLRALRAECSAEIRAAVELQERIQGRLGERAHERQRRVEPDASLEELLGRRSAGELAAIARRVGLEANGAAESPMDLCARIARELLDARATARRLATLPAPARATLAALGACGGWLEYATFTRLYGSDAAEDWAVAEPASIHALLKREGLVIDGLRDRCECVLVPPPLLRSVLDLPRPAVEREWA